SAIFSHKSTSDLNHLVVLNDAEEAAYFHNTLESLTSALDLFYFPSSFKNRKNFKLLNSSHVMLWTEMLMRLSAGGNKKIIITYPEALIEKQYVAPPISANVCIHLCFQLEVVNDKPGFLLHVTRQYFLTESLCFCHQYPYTFALLFLHCCEVSV
ncbi:MAG: hypothetical protein H7320_11935, partial [Ferruginibacter sp.]|nr:hypothetical protein [Ferruginibacter sp.]